jgi:hypothetical protein
MRASVAHELQASNSWRPSAAKNVTTPTATSLHESQRVGMALARRLVWNMPAVLPRFQRAIAVRPWQSLSW